MPPYEIRCYKIWWENNPEMYVGSTKQRLSMRMCEHRADAKKGKTQKIFEAIRKYGYDFNYVMLESFTINNSDEKRMREQFWIDELKPSLNSIRAYINVNDVKMRDKHTRTIYRKTNRAKILNTQKEYRKNNAEQRKAYYQTNKEEIKQKRNEYYHTNKEKISRERKERRARGTLQQFNQKSEQEVPVAQ